MPEPMTYVSVQSARSAPNLGWTALTRRGGAYGDRDGVRDGCLLAALSTDGHGVGIGPLRERLALSDDDFAAAAEELIATGLAARGPGRGGSLRRVQARSEAIPPSSPRLGSRRPLDALDLDVLERACRQVPLTTTEYVATDFVLTLLETVVDYQQHTTTVENCVKYFTDHCWNEVRTLDDLVGLFVRFPNDKTGNTALAQYLWGFKLWTRAEQLRGLVAFLADNGIDDLDGLRRWAAASTFKTFEGRVKGLGPVVYQWLVMRLGVPTVNPDVHVLRFCQAALGRVVSEQDTISGLTTVAGRLGVPPHRLDWPIWEYQRGGGT